MLGARGRLSPGVGFCKAAYTGNVASRDIRPGTRGVPLDGHGVRTLATRLALEHERAPRSASPLSAQAMREGFEEQQRAIGRALPELSELAERVVSAQLRFLERCGAALADRVRSGRVRQLSGPGREEGASAARDTATELAGRILDLDLAGHGDLSERLLSAYAGEADDFGLFAVIDFYARACALERAARIARRADEPGRAERADEARRLLLLAHSTHRRPLVPPALVAVGGQVASGKTTLSRALAERLGAPRIEADAVRNALLGDRPGHEVHEAHWARHLEPGFEQRVYDELLRRAAEVLESGRPLVIAACFPRARQREEAAALARRAGLPFLFVECHAEVSAVRRRLAERDAQQQRGGWNEVHSALAERWEAGDGLPPEQRVVVDTTDGLDEALTELERRLPSWPEELRS